MPIQVRLFPPYGKQTPEGPALRLFRGLSVLIGSRRHTLVEWGGEN